MATLLRGKCNSVLQLPRVYRLVNKKTAKSSLTDKLKHENVITSNIFTMLCLQGKSKPIFKLRHENQIILNIICQIRFVVTRQTNVDFVRKSGV